MAATSPRNADEKQAEKNLRTACRSLRRNQRLTDTQKRVLQEVLNTLFLDALPYFRMRPDVNPVHHNTQVLDNMVRIALASEPDYRMLTNACILSLLHDIGNGISEKTKIKTDEIKDITDEMERTVDKRKRRALKKDAADLAVKAIAFRIEHMDKGPPLVSKLTRRLVSSGVLREEDVHLICRAVQVHDYPTVERLMETCRQSGVETGFAPGDFLLPCDNTPFGILTTFLREADRLYMVTDQGVEKDLQGQKTPISPDDTRKKRTDNGKKHRKEYMLYKNVGKSDGFIKRTLYRTAKGYSIFWGWLSKDWPGKTVDQILDT